MASWKVIRVDDDVYTSIQQNGKFGESVNTVLRRMLNMNAPDGARSTDVSVQLQNAPSGHKVRRSANRRNARSHGT